jgi:UDP-N-acetylmuramate dehydrogenase
MRAGVGSAGAATVTDTTARSTGLAERLRGIVRGEILVGEPLSRHTYFRIGGPADVMAYPADLEDLKALLAVARRDGIQVLILGGGSNMLVLDGGFGGLVINLSRSFRELSSSDEQIRCGAGVRTSRLVAFSARAGLAGLEAVTGVPGTVGGAIHGNAGTHVGSITDHLDWVRLVDESGEERCLLRRELDIRYRRVVLPPGAVVIESAHTLRRGAASEIRRTISGLLVRRHLTQPVEARSAGCIFKNPPGDFAGRLVEQAGLKGTRRGGAQISERHANFVVNLGGATASDVLWLIERASAEVEARTGVALELEIQVVGSPCPA